MSTERVEVGGLPVVRWPALDALGVDVVVTTRHGGVSAEPWDSLNLGLHVGDEPADVIANRERVATAFGTTLDDFVFCRQVHQPVVAVVGREHAGRGTRSDADAIPGTDALVTTTPGLVLVVMVADCVPVLIVDPVRRVLACVHAGWGGAVRGVTPAAVSAMVSLGCDPADLVAAIGPSIDPDVYQVGDDVVELAGDAFGDRLGDVVRPDGTGRHLFDLWRAATIQLTDAGVPASSVHLAGLGTGPGTDFYSHRLTGACGRFALVARLRQENA